MGWAVSAETCAGPAEQTNIERQKSMARETLKTRGAANWRFFAAGAALYALLFLATWVMAWPLYEVAAQLWGIGWSWMLPLMVVAGEVGMLCSFAMGQINDKGGILMALPLVIVLVLLGVETVHANGMVAKAGVIGNIVVGSVTVAMPWIFGAMAARYGALLFVERAEAAAQRRARKLSQPVM